MSSQARLTLATDGASRGNPGPAAIAYSILDQDETPLAKDSRPIGKATNNEAEYDALLFGLENLLQETNGPVLHVSDSQLLVRQMNGDYKIRANQLARKAKKARRLASNLETLRHEHVPRTDPRIRTVDELANEALDRK